MFSLSRQGAETLLASLSSDVVVLPREITADGVGYYPDAVIDLVKELSTNGVDANFAHAKDARSWIAEKSAAPLLDFAIGILSSAGWAAIVAMFASRQQSTPIRAKIVRHRQTANESTWEWYELEGAPGDVAKQMREIEPPAAPDDEE